MQGQGFTVAAVDMNDLSEIKRSSGVPPKLESCHTALVGGYVIEGHVPADLVKKILAGEAEDRGARRAGDAGRRTGHGYRQNTVRRDRVGQGRHDDRIRETVAPAGGIMERGIRELVVQPRTRRSEVL